MKKTLAKIWIPTLFVLMAAFQSFGIDTYRAAKIFGFADSLGLTATGDTTAAAAPAIDSLHTTDSIRTDIPDSLAVTPLFQDSSVTDTLPKDTVILTARDTIRIPDSLQETDPFFYKYYIAVKDSTTRMQVRDSLILANDSLELHKFDSLYIKDSTEVAIAEYNARYASMSRRERKKHDAELALPGLIAMANR